MACPGTGPRLCTHCSKNCYDDYRPMCSSVDTEANVQEVIEGAGKKITIEEP